MRWFDEFVRRLGEKLKGSRPVTGLRQQSITDTDHNATYAASRAQADSDRGDRLAGSPADQGGQG